MDQPVEEGDSARDHAPSIQAVQPDARSHETQLLLLHQEFHAVRAMAQANPEILPLFPRLRPNQGGQHVLRGLELAGTDTETIGHRLTQENHRKKDDKPTSPIQDHGRQHEHAAAYSKKFAQ